MQHQFDHESDAKCTIPFEKVFRTLENVSPKREPKQDPPINDLKNREDINVESTETYKERPRSATFNHQEKGLYPPGAAMRSTRPPRPWRPR
eukprot:1189142-Prorocentrum_minimum.AAC.2